MAIAVQLDFKGGTLAQYDQVVKKMGFKREGSGGPGGLFHWVTKTSDGIRVTDVWKTKEVFGKFSEQKIVPITKEFGLPQPTVQFFEVHNYLTKG